MELQYTYTNPLMLTQQFRFCGNPLRCDFYKNCSFQCNYCFAKTHGGIDKFHSKVEVAKFEIVENLFKRAFDNYDENDKNIVVELLRRKTPIHCGGMADPFQPLEFKLHLTYKLIELSNKYEVPICFSTKQSKLPDEYYEILNPKLHAFQISLISDDAEWLKKYEPNVASPDDRIAFMKLLKSKGFWVAMRVQPLIDLQHALNVMLKVEDIVDYITVEHLKIAANSTYQMELFSEYLKDYYKPKSSRYFEKNIYLKTKEVLYLQERVTKCKIGVGDNDLHHLSQSRCCCGIDTIGGLFDNYLKYNLTYFITDNVTVEEKDNLYVPEGNCSGCFMSNTVIKGLNKVKHYVDDYCCKNLNFVTNEELKKYYESFFLNAENIRKFDKNQERKNQVNIFDLFDEEE